MSNVFRCTIRRVHLYIYFTTGYSPGEGAAICWPDIDFELLTLKTYKRYSGDKNKFFPPKTDRSIREIPISKKGKSLFAVKKITGKSSKREGVENIDQLVFFDYRYGIPSCTAVTKALRKILRELELPTTMSVGGMRHTYGSYLLAKKVDIWVVAKILGHKDIQQLMETYGHLLQEIEKEGFQEIRE